MSEGKQEFFDEEAAYDEKISPLMEQIIAICHEHKIPMVATFNYANRKDGPDFCTTCINTPTERLSERIDKMRRVALDEPSREFLRMMFSSGTPKP